MTEFAVVDDGVIVGYGEFDAPPVLAGKPYRRFLPVAVTDPAFDPDTQVRTGPVVTIEADRVTRVWTVTDKTAGERAAEIAEQRDQAMAPIDATEDVVRAAVLVILDELNLHAARLAAVLQAATGAGTFAAFKTAMSGIGAIPSRTPTQLRQAIRNKLGT